MSAWDVSGAVVWTGAAILCWASPAFGPHFAISTPGAVISWFMVSMLFSLGGTYCIARVFGAREG